MRFLRDSRLIEQVKCCICPQLVATRPSVPSHWEILTVELGTEAAVAPVVRATPALKRRRHLLSCVFLGSPRNPFCLFEYSLSGRKKGPCLNPLLPNFWQGASDSKWLHGSFTHEIPISPQPDVFVSQRLHFLLPSLSARLELKLRTVITGEQRLDIMLIYLFTEADEYWISWL